MAAPDTAGAVRRRVTTEDLEQPCLEIHRPILLQPGHVFGCLGGEGHCVRRWGVERGVHFVDPSGFRIGKGVVGGDVGLDVEDRRAVDEITRAEDQLPFLDLDQLHRRDADRIGAMGGARGEDASPFRGAARREHFRAPVGIAMEPPDEPDAIEAFEVLERLLIFVARKHLEDVGLGLLLVRLMTGVEFQRLPGADEADGRDGESRIQDDQGLGLAGQKAKIHCLTFVVSLAVLLRNVRRGHQSLLL